jgi:prepilin-type N-terminal cleavage/methylation domain-containing protein
MKSLRPQSGYTIIELMVSMSVSLVFGLAVLGYYRSETAALRAHSAFLDATDKVRAAMAFLTREIRLAGYDPGLTALVVPGQKGIVDARSDFLWIKFDRNEDGSIQTGASDPDAESVAYSYDAANRQILRTVAGVSTPLVDNVPPGSFTFQYFDIVGNQMTMGTVTFPSCPGLPTSVATAASAEPGLTGAQRDLVALIRVSVQVGTVGLTPSTNLPLSTRVSVPARTLDRL